VLVPPPALERVLAIARAVPDIGDTIGLECRLGPAAGPVDLGIAIRRRSGGRRADEPLPADPAWRRLSAFRDAWDDPTSRLHSWIPFVFLEFDAVGPPGIPQPSVFVTLDWPLVDPSDADAERDVRRLSATVVHDALLLLLGSRALSRRVANLDRCMDALPDEGRVVHAGAMLGRRGSGVRLSLAMRREAHPRYLQHVGLTPLVDAVESIVTTFAPDEHRVHVEIDVAETIGPRLGVVLACDRADGWARLLARIEDNALCTAAESAELLRWPEISHLKITPGDTGRHEAKAYVTLARRVGRDAG
jgi:hypothetical protein